MESVGHGQLVHYSRQFVEWRPYPWPVMTLGYQLQACLAIRPGNHPRFWVSHDKIIDGRGRGEILGVKQLIIFGYSGWCASTAGDEREKGACEGERES